ncbi:unnamed protein product [Polarella glacialis]|uniref:Uncharacterized protein n=1 Tax=Polarella glacialis TaxID=89957 RepID=A0A813KTT3_POLGL|nr:unnamed protein product [Polarella glacialis]
MDGGRRPFQAVPRWSMPSATQLLTSILFFCFRVAIAICCCFVAICCLFCCYFVWWLLQVIVCLLLVLLLLLVVVVVLLVVVLFIFLAFSNCEVCALFAWRPDLVEGRPLVQVQGCQNTFIITNYG